MTPTPDPTTPEEWQLVREELLRRLQRVTALEGEVGRLRGAGRQALRTLEAIGSTAQAQLPSETDVGMSLWLRDVEYWPSVTALRAALEEGNPDKNKGVTT